VTVFDRQSLSRRRFLKGTAITAGHRRGRPVHLEARGLRGAARRRQPGHPDHDLPRRRQRRPQHGRPVTDAAYATLRPSLKITNGSRSAAGLALHPSLTKLKARFDQGKVAIVRGVGYQPADLSHFSSADIWMHGWGGATTPTTGWLGRYLDTLPNTAHESLYGVGLHGGVNRAPRGRVSHASSLPLNIGDAFGIDRSDPSDARMYDALIRLGAVRRGSARSATSTTGRERVHAARAADPARVRLPDQPTDIRSSSCWPRTSSTPTSGSA
jgi:hypothetical protein